MLDDIEGLSPELKAKIEADIAAKFVAKSEFDAVNAKKEELLGETKKAKEAARLAAEQAAEEARQKAIKDKDIEGLNASYAEKEAALNARLAQIEGQVKTEKIGALAQKFVSEKFVRDPVISEAIAEKFAKRLDIRDGKIVVLGADGALTGLSVDDLQTEFLNNGAYKAHIISTNASGGGASGGSRNGTGGANVKPLTQAKTKEERRAAIAASTGLPI